jgi:hypothetical protein
MNPSKACKKHSATRTAQDPRGAARSKTQLELEVELKA